MASFSARGGPWEDSGASWQQSWFQERACEGFTGLVGSCGDLSVELAASEECELLEVQDKTEWENLQLAVNKDWVLTRAVKIGDVKVPPGATLCPDRASLAITDDQCSPDWALPAFDSIRKPAAVAFFRTPRLGEADKGTCLRYLIKQASLQADVGRNLHLIDLTGGRGPCGRSGPRRCGVSEAPLQNGEGHMVDAQFRVDFLGFAALHAHKNPKRSLVQGLVCILPHGHAESPRQAPHVHGVVVACVVQLGVPMRQRSNHSASLSSGLGRRRKLGIKRDRSADSLLLGREKYYHRSGRCFGAVARG